MSRPLSQKRRPAILATSVAVLFSLGFLLDARKASADEYWDGTNTTGSGTTNGAGGSGTWDNAITNWVDVSGNNPAPYDPNQTAIFATLGGTVTLGDNISFTSLRFDADGYIIDPGGGPFTLTATGSGFINVSGGNNATINAQLTGSVGIDFEGTGTITLTNTSNDYTGGTTIGTSGVAPTVIISADSQLGAAVGGVTFDGGTLENTANVTSARTITLDSGGGTFMADAGTTMQLDGVIGGSGALTVSGPGKVVLTNTGNTYTGGTNINGATLVISDNSELGNSGAITFDGGTLETTANVTSARPVTLNSGGGTFLADSGTTMQLDGVIGGSGALTVSGPGKVVLTNTGNTYTGGTNINGGTLVISDNGNLGNSGAIAFAGGTLENTANVTSARTITINSGGGKLLADSGTTMKLDGVIGGSGALTVSGSGKVLLTNTGNTYSGGTNINGGTLVISDNGNLGNSGAITFTGGTLETTANVTTSRTITINSAGATFSPDSGTTFEVDGAIGGSGNLTVNGLGTLTLTGTNTYSGATTVSRGTLVVAPTTSTALLASSSTLVLGGAASDGGTFQLNGIVGTATTQVLNGLIVNSSQNQIIVNNVDSSTSTTLDLRGTSLTAGITHNGGSVDFAAASGNLSAGPTGAIILTSQANDSTGILGGWATVNHGADLATKDSSGHIVAYTGYTDIYTQGAVIPNSPSANIRLVNPPSPAGNDTLATQTTNINTLTQNATTDSTIDTAGGTLRLGANGGILLASVGANLTIGTTANPGVLTAGGNSSNAAGTLTLNNSSASSLLAINSAITNNGTGTVSVVIAGGGITAFHGANTYTGTTTISGGTLRVDADNSTSAQSDLLINTGATFNVNDHSTTVGGINNGAAGGGTITLGSVATTQLTVGADNANGNFSGTITGAGQIIKSGTGTQTFSTGNSYSGGTTLNSGRLNVNNGSALGTGTLTINGGTIGTTATSGVTINNHVVVGGDFSVATNLDTSNPGNQNFIFGGTVDLNGGTRTITGVTIAGQVHFSGGISNGGITFTTSATVNADPTNPYVAFIYDGSANSYTGLTTVQDHAFLVLQRLANNDSIRGDVLITGNGVVDYLGNQFLDVSNQIADNATVTVNSPGNTISGGLHFDGLELRGFSDTIGTLNGNSTGTVGLGSGTLTVGAGNFSGVIEDGGFGTGGSLAKNTAGTLILSGANTYTGTTTVSAGTLQAGAVNTLSGASAVTVASGATLDLNNFSQKVASIAGGGAITLGAGTLTAGSNNSSTTFSGAITGTGGLTKVGTGMLTLTGSNTYTGNTTVTRGTVTLTPGSIATPVLSSSSTLVLGGSALNDGGTFRLTGISGNATSQTLNGLVVNAGSNFVIIDNIDAGTTTTLNLGSSITHNANGFVDFSATNGTLGSNAHILTTQANDASGILGAWATVNNGSDFATNVGNEIVGLGTVAGGYTDIAATFDTVPNGSNLNVRINSAVGPGSTVNDIIAAHPVTSISTLTQNTGTASTIDLAGGKLRFGADGGILVTPTGGNLTIGATANDGVITAGDGTSSTPTTLTFANNSASTLTINSVIADSGSGIPLSVRLTGTGTTVFAGTNTYTGSTAILAGTLRTDAVNALSSATVVTLNSGATLNLNDKSQTVASITDGPSGGGNIAFGASNSATLTTGSNNSDATLSGVISGGGNLVKVGTGMLTLSGNNTYTGNTTLGGGGLTLNSNTALGSGAGTLTIQNGTKIGTQKAGGVTITNSVSVQGDFSVFTNVDTTVANQNFNFNGATFDLNGATRTITGLTNGGQVQFGSASAIINGGLTLNTSFTKTGDYVKFIYNGANTYSGKTTVNNGAFLVFQGTTANGGTHGDVDIEGNGVVLYNVDGQQIADTATVTVNSGGNSAGGQFFGGFDLLNTTAETIGTLNGSTDGLVALGATNLTISAGDFKGTILDRVGSGLSGQITKNGTGTLILENQNFYTGGTTLNSGILQIRFDPSLGDSSGALNINGGILEVTGISLGTNSGETGSKRTVNLNATGTFQIDENAILELHGVIQGSGGLIKTGTGEMLISGNSNTYTGPTSVNAGKLFLSGTSVSLVTVNNGGTFIFQSGAHLNTGSNSTPVTVTNKGTFDNFGNLTVTGATSNGTRLTQNDAVLNNFTGGVISGNTGVLVSNSSGIATIINFGTIIGTFAAVDAQTNNSAGVKIGDFGTFTGAVKMGTGINSVILGTGIHYTPIAGGAGQHDTLRLAGGAQDTLNLADFSGYEFLNKVGGGMWTLTGTTPFSGGTSIDGGILNVSGNLVSNTRIAVDGVLSGTGMVTGNLNNFGIVLPGLPVDVIASSATPGTLRLQGNYNQSSLGTLTIQINGTGANQYSRLAISGRAQLNGSLVLRNNSSIVNLRLGQKLTFLTADGGVSGTFSNVINPLATGTVVVGKIVYDANSVSVQGAQGSFTSVDSQFHLTHNQNAVARALDSAVPDPRSAKLINFLDTRPIKKLPEDFDHIAPEEMASVYRLGFSLADVQARNVQRRTADLRAGTSGFSAAGFETTGSPNYSGGLAGANGPTGTDAKATDEKIPDRRWGTFITGVGDFAHVGDSGNARGYDLNTGGVTVGADYKLTPNAAVGVTAGYAGTNANLTDDGRLLVNSGRVGVYGTYYTGGYYADAAVTGGVTNYSTRRSSLEGVASGSTQGNSLDVLVDTGYDWRMDALTIGPTASFQYTYVGIDGFTEHGSLTPLRYAGQHQYSIRSTFGLRMAYDWKVGSVLVRPEVRLNWQHEYGDRSYSIDSALASGAGELFTVSDTPIGRDSLLFGAGVAVLWNPRTSTYLYYDADLLKKEYNSQSVSGGLRLNF